MGVLAAGCATADELPTTTAVPTLSPSATALASPSPLPTDTPEPPTATATPTSTRTNTPTSTPTFTPLPPGYVAVPDVIGLPYREARSAILRAGLNFVYRDVFDLELPTGTILFTDPIAGTGRPRDSLVFLYRTFQAPPAIVGDLCYPLRLITSGGKLLYYVDLEEDTRYEIRTGFPYGQTSIFDVQMFLLDEFENSKSNHMDFLAPYTARYVIALGPYSISQNTVDANPGGVDVGCLWVTPIED
jgi:hypothetical protein